MKKKGKDRGEIWKAQGQLEVERKHEELKRIIMDWNPGGKMETRL